MNKVIYKLKLTFLAIKNFFVFRLDTLANTVDSVTANLGNQKKLSRRVKALEGKLNESNESLQWLICAFRDSNFVPKNQPKEGLLMLMIVCLFSVFINLQKSFLSYKDYAMHLPII